MAELGQKEALFHEQVCEYARGKVEEFLCVGELWEGGLKYLPKVGKCFKSKEDLFDYISDPKSLIKKLSKVTSKIILGSFPKFWNILTLQRSIRYKIRKT